MNCKKCGSENIINQTVNETHYRSKRNLLIRILFWGYFLTLYVIKLGVYLIYQVVKWLVLVPFGFIKSKISKTETTYRDPQFIKNLMRKRGKNYNIQKTIAVCQNCGNSWNVA